MRKYLLTIIVVLISLAAFSTHQRAGEITYKAISNLKYEFTIVTYTYTLSPADRPELRIEWGDGTSQVVPRTQKINYPNDISRNVYAGAVHTFPGQGTYVVSVEDPNRNDGVLNIPNSVSVPFFIRTELVINPFIGPNNSVDLLAPPIDIGCVNNLYLHNPAAFDADGDSLSYKLVDCRGAFGLPIPGYILPNEIDTTVQTTFDINPITGTITWDNPILQGEYNIAFLVEEWRNGIRIGYVTRDMQIEIIACDNQPPVIGEMQDTCVMAGTTLEFSVQASDPDDDTLVISALGGPFRVDESPASFPHAIGYGTVNSTFTWNTICSHVQFQPYQVVFTARDTFKFPQLTDIKTVSIRVISPPPENLSATAVGNSIHLSWNQAPCDRTIGYDLYRRDGLYGLEPGPCEPGIPEESGYVKIATLESYSDTTFIDDNQGMGLVHGIDYCYTVVAFFAEGSESYPSQEACAALKKDVPIITNVSINQTSLTQGEIFVAWSKPTEMDTLIYSGPYTYVINRADSENTQFTVISENQGINDTLFTDVSGLNTTDLKYSYRINMYSNENGDEVLVGSTQVAKSIFLNVAPTDEALQLSWNAEAPWINYRHNIYRYNQQTEVFDSIGFSNNVFYTDTNLVNGQEYTYYIKSIGEYSAPGLVNPILNYSQINSGTPKDIVPPCPPVLSVATNCEASQNTLSWENPADCPEDIAGYFIYYTSIQGDTLLLIDSLNWPEPREYEHVDLPSIAGCYQVAAFDSLRNFSERSNLVCVDISECATYSLPNFFSPNQDDKNQVFRPFPNYTSVERVDFKVFNRWGRIVFKTDNPEINWDGKNLNNNQDCAEGVYFYVCDVYEIRLEGLSKRTLTGSITLLR